MNARVEGELCTKPRVRTTILTCPRVFQSARLASNQRAAVVSRPRCDRAQRRLRRGATFVVALLLYGLFSRLVAFGPHARFIAGTSVAAAAFGIGYAFGGSDGVRLLCFCLQTACCAALVVSWGERLHALLPHARPLVRRRRVREPRAAWRACSRPRRSSCS